MSAVRRRDSKQQSLPGTVFLVKKKALVHKINYLYILTSPLESKVYADSKTGIKKSHTIIEGHTFSDSNCGGEMAIQFCKSVWGKLPKFEQISKKRIDPSDVATLSFRWLIHFWYFWFQKRYKPSLALYLIWKQKYQKWTIHRKLRVAMSVIYL